MAKRTFTHGYSARNTLWSIRSDYGMEGVGAYWCFIEILYEHNGCISEGDLKGIALELRISEDLLHGVIYDSGLFVISDGKITSGKVNAALERKRSISAVRQDAAFARWGKENPNPADSAEAVGVPVPSPGADEETTTEREADKAAQFREVFAKRLDEFESRGLPDGIIWKCRAPFEGVIDAVAKRERFKISGQYVKSGDILYSLQYFVQADNALAELDGILTKANDKTARGGISNKLNYLVTALYQAAKLGGW